MKFEIEPIATEFTFDAKEKTASKRVQFYKELYGYKNSPYGKYTYIKDGLLSNIKHLKPTNSTIIVRLKDAKTLRNFLKKHKAKFDEKIVILNKTEAHQLGLKYHNEWEKLYEEIKGNKNFRVTIDI